MKVDRAALAAALEDVLTFETFSELTSGELADKLADFVDAAGEPDHGHPAPTEGVATRFAWDCDEYWQPLAYVAGRLTDWPAKRLRTALLDRIDPEFAGQLLIEEQRIEPVVKADGSIDTVLVDVCLDTIRENSDDAVLDELEDSEIAETVEALADLAARDSRFRALTPIEIRDLGVKVGRDLCRWAEWAIDDTGTIDPIAHDMAPKVALSTFPLPVPPAPGQTELELGKDG